MTTKEFEANGVIIIETTEMDENGVTISQSTKPIPKKKWWENENETLFFNRIREAIRIFKVN